MFSNAGGTEAETSPAHADRSAATTARTDGCGRLTLRRVAAGKAEMASAGESTSASRRSLAAAPARISSSTPADGTAVSSSSLAAAESESSEWSGAASGLRFRFRHLRRESGSQDSESESARSSDFAPPGQRIGCSGRISTHEPGVEEALRGIVGGDGAGVA
jgi:hypothetical protein